jgi:hypothetical protein
MPPLVDPDLLRVYRQILSNWYVTGYVTAKDQALEWASENLPGFTLKDLATLFVDDDPRDPIIRIVRIKDA